MTGTSHPEYNDHTEALEVASVFPEEIQGKTVLVTGVNRSGLGFTTAEAFASQGPARLILVGRSQSKIQESLDALKAQYPSVDYRALLMDLSSQRSVRAAAAELLSWTDVPAIDIVVNNAAVMLLPERVLSEDGIEMHLATNHVGHFLFTCLIMPRLLRAAEGARRGATRIVNVSALSPKVAAMRWSDVSFATVSRELPVAEQPCYPLHEAWGVADPPGRAYLPLEGYNQSKVANVLFGVAANARLCARFGVLSLALHPGVIRTELERNAAPDTLAAYGEMIKRGDIVLRSPGAGAATTLVAATDPKLAPGSKTPGVFLMDCQVYDDSDFRAVSTDEADKLWRLSEELVKEKFDW